MARLRIAVAQELAELDPRSGHGRMWRSVLPELGRLARVRAVAPGARVRADAWLADGHAPALDVDDPVVAFVHEAPWGEPALVAGMTSEFREAMERVSRATAARATRILTPSQAARAQIAQAFGIPEDRIDAVAHGVDAAAFAAARGGGLARVGSPYVLFVSQLHPRKNLAALRDAMGAIADGHALAIVASPAADRPDSSELAAAAFAPLPGVEVVRVDGPSDSELASLMADADAFCLPSLFEGFGLTALEAMACGAPVICSDRGALPEVVGAAGIVTRPDAAALEEALRRVLGDAALAQRMRAQGRARAAGFTWRRTAEGWLEALRRAVESAS